MPVINKVFFYKRKYNIKIHSNISNHIDFIFIYMLLYIYGVEVKKKTVTKIVSVF